MFKITQSDNTSYAEVGQVNPLRWKTLFRQDDNNFVDQSGWIKCKDFYNDTVAFFKEGTKFSIWGYKNDIKKNAEGVYFLLKYVKDVKQFMSNLETVNVRLNKDLGCVVAAQEYGKDEVVILIPNELWESTYRISMITMVVRLCNYGLIIKTWEDFWKSDGPVFMDKVWTDQKVINRALNEGFNVPDKFKKYWFYAGDNYNSVVAPKTTGGTIHNNGVVNWTMFMEKAA